MANQIQFKLGKKAVKKDERTIKLSTLIRTELLPPLPDSFDLDSARGSGYSSSIYE